MHIQQALHIMAWGGLIMTGAALLLIFLHYFYPFVSLNISS
jgi:hypothetical protein